MYKVAEKAKDSMFGIIVVIWGFVLLCTKAMTVELTLTLLAVTFSQTVLGFMFIGIGALYILAKFLNINPISALANILISFIFLIVMLTHLFASVYAIAWIAFAGIVIHQAINAYLILKGTK